MIITLPHSTTQKHETKIFIAKDEDQFVVIKIGGHITKNYALCG
jgi:hypothetical protein